MKKILILLVIACFFVNQSNAQLEATGDLSHVLNELNGGWGVGNGCLVGVPTVANVYGGIELNGNHLQIMDCTIQVFGDVTNFGIVIDPSEFESHELITLYCEGASLVVYSETLDIEEPVNVIESDLKIFPNPFYDQFTIISGTIIPD